MKEPTSIEKAGGSLPMKLAATALAAIEGGLLTAFLPVLIDSIPARRHTERVKEALKQLEGIVDKHSEEIKHLSDSQYKLINNAALTILSTVEEQKIEYLKRVVNNSFAASDIRFLETEIVSRWIRDISAEELEFILDNYSHERIAVVEESLQKPISDKEKYWLFIDPKSRENSIVGGLISLGVLVPSGPNADTIGTYTFSDVTAKLIVLLNVNK